MDKNIKTAHVYLYCKVYISSFPLKYWSVDSGYLLFTHHTHKFITSDYGKAPTKRRHLMLKYKQNEQNHWLLCLYSNWKLILVKFNCDNYFLENR